MIVKLTLSESALIACDLKGQKSWQGIKVKLALNAARQKMYWGRQAPNLNTATSAR